MYKKVKIFSILICAISIIMLLTVCAKNVNEEEQSNKDIKNIKKYLRKNHSTIRLNNSQKSLSILEPYLNENEIFITGEVHGVDVNNELEYNLLTYFHDKADVNYYLNEMPYSFSMYINNYIETGDEEILSEIFKYYKGTSVFNKQEVDKWKKVYKLNLSLSDDKKIKVIGIDVEHKPLLGFKYLSELASQAKVPSELKSLIDKLNEIKANEQVDDLEMKEFITQFKRDLEQNNSLYEKWLGVNFFDFSFVVNNIYNKYDLNNQASNARDIIMYGNFIELYNRLPKGKYFGQFGLYHVFQKNIDGLETLASLLKGSESPVEGRVMSIAYIYKDSTQLYHKDGTIASATNYYSESDMFNSDSRSSLTLFNLIGNKSPFNDKLIWMFSQPTVYEGKTTDYFQFVVFIKNGSATTPIE